VDHLSPKQLQKVQRWKRTRDFIYLVLLLWIIFKPSDALISLPVLLVTWMLVRLFESWMKLET
jgi:hypothetical protein